MPFRDEKPNDRFHHEYTEGFAAGVNHPSRKPPFNDLESEEAQAWLRGYNEALKRPHRDGTEPTFAKKPTPDQT